MFARLHFHAVAQHVFSTESWSELTQYLVELNLLSMKGTLNHKTQLRLILNSSHWSVAKPRLLKLRLKYLFFYKCVPVMCWLQPRTASVHFRTYLHHQRSG